MKRIELFVGGLLLLICVLTALTQPVNPFPEDGWFRSRSRILEHSPGGDNYTPVAAPAFLYAALHGVGVVVGWNLEAEFYAGSFLHHLLLFLTGLFLYLSHRCLGLPKSGLVVSALAVLFVESTLVPQAFWSENLTMCLMSAVLFIACYLFQNVDLSDLRFRGFTVAFGLLLGALVVSRLIPIFILPGLILLLRARLPRSRVVSFGLVATVALASVILLSMSANLYRYGRFELSNSVGRHLWNVVSPCADVMLADSREYQSLKQVVPDVQGKLWWEVARLLKVSELHDPAGDEPYKKFAFHAISRNPATFVRLGAMNFRAMLIRCPARLGLHRASFNPLPRETMLPAMLFPFPLLEKVLAGFHRFMKRVYPALICGALLLGAAAFLAALVFGRHLRNGTLLHRNAWLFTMYVFVVGLYASVQIEQPDSRYPLLFLPFFALSVSAAGSMMIETSARIIEVLKSRRSADAS